MILALFLRHLAPQNGDTVSLPSLIPAPVSLQVSNEPAFVLTSGTVLRGDHTATRAFRTQVAARTDGDVLLSTEGTDAPHDTAPTVVTLEVDASDPDGAPESYRIEATSQAVTVTGADAAGLFYGVHTLVQLLRNSDRGWVIPPVVIDDAPRFRYRGVMLDVARHFHDVATVTAYIDRAAALKFNALHLHLTDDQAWRLDILSRPLLTERASQSSVGGDPGGFYTHDDYREIVAYAAAQHMIVVPEIDMPGHTHAVSLAYPELSEEPVLSDHIREIVRDYGGELPANGAAYTGMAVGFSSLRIHDAASYAFIDDVLGEVAALTPGPYLHVGGDEALGTSAEDFALFMQRVTQIAAATGKTPIAWHEAGAATGLAPGTVGQYWGFVSPTDGMDDKARRFTENGAQLILSPADAIYLDMKFDADSPLGLVWAGITSLRRSYEWDPAGVIEGIGDEQILGIEAPLWTETVRTLTDIDTLAYPRIAAAAEAGWSPAVGASPLRTWESFLTRVGALGPLWQSQGIAFAPLSEVPWMAEHSRSASVHSIDTESAAPSEGEPTA